MAQLTPKKTHLTPLRVLIVEDSENDALLILRELRCGGYEPAYERVQTPEEMRAALAASDWDLIVSDYGLPRFGAPEALEVFREADLSAPFVVVSGRVGEDVAVEMMRAGAHDYVMKDNLARLCATVERGLADAAGRRRAEEELRRRDAILEAVRFAAERFLADPDGGERGMAEALERLGLAAEASRVYVFRNHRGPDGALWNAEVHKWAAPGIPLGVPAGPDRVPVTDFPYRDDGSGHWTDFGRWEEVLGRGEPMHGNVADFPEKERAFLGGTLGIRSMILVPIFVEDGWWGFIGFDDCERERGWSTAEIDALKAAASTLGAALRRRAVERQLGASETRYRALIEQATDGIYLLDAGTRRIVEANPSFGRMLGHDPDELLGTAVYDFVAHPRENVDATIERTLREGRRVVGERRYRRKDGSEIDVEVGVSVIHLDGRAVICTIVRDVTERKGAETRLREAEFRYRTLVEQIPATIYIQSPDPEGSGAYAVEYMSPQVEKVLGHPARRFVEDPGFWNTVTHPRDLERMVAETRRTDASGEPFNLEYRMRDAAGGYRWIRDEAVLVRDEENNPLYWQGVFADVTERKEAEAALAQSEGRMRQIIETEPECVKVLGPDGALLEMNPAGLSMIEADSLEQVRGISVYRYIAPDHRAAFVELTERVLRGGSGTLEFELVGLKGGHRWLETHAVPLEDTGTGTRGLLAITRDVSERKEAEEALRQSERLYRTVVEQATENIFLVDVETLRIVESNPAFRVALGYSEEELHRMTLYDVVAHDRASVDANVRRVTERKDPSVGERKYRRKDGTLLDMEVSAGVILRGGRETICAVAHDVTERARMQRVLEERIATLSRISAGMTLDPPGKAALDALAGSAVDASPAVACGVVLVGEEGVDLFGSHGLPEGYTAGLQEAYQKGVQSPSLEAFRTRSPVLVRDLRRAILSDPLYEPVHHFVREAEWDIVYSLPLVARRKELGAIFFCFRPGEEPDDDEKTFLRAVADQAAVVVENARLFSEARGKAALEERQRLARELHDSVSQALYGISLGAHTALEIAEHDPERVKDPLGYVLSLAEAGLAEMRALIFELRPESLETEGLVAALEKQAAALRARHQVGVQTVLCEEPEAAPETKEALYRIVQEALHNTVKHARAKAVEVKMSCAPGWISVEISDDGVGFDTSGDFPGHLGLRSMRERAANLGGTLDVTSAPGLGATIRTTIPTDPGV